MDSICVNLFLVSSRRQRQKTITEILGYPFYTKYFLYYVRSVDLFFMMTSSNGNIFRVTGHLCGKFTGHRWISHTKASDAELWCLHWSAPEWTVE